MLHFEPGDNCPVIHSLASIDQGTCSYFRSWSLIRETFQISVMPTLRVVCVSLTRAPTRNGPEAGIRSWQVLPLDIHRVRSTQFGGGWVEASCGAGVGAQTFRLHTGSHDWPGYGPSSSTTYTPKATPVIGSALHPCRHMRAAAWYILAYPEVGY